ncbi:MAG: hypothetical protein ACJAS1_005255 [Oleiphilaceae bacterium]|jgi:hypothetical protein
MFYEHVKELANEWPAYLSNVTEDKHHNAYKLINEYLREDLREITQKQSYYKIDSSGGAGNITSGPWFATFDTRVTSSSQNGFYVVFLFSIDMQRLVLELGFGTTQFTKFYGENKSTLAKIRAAAVHLQTTVSGLVDNFDDQSFTKRLDRRESDLSTKPTNRLQIGYEKASIFNISYDIDTIETSTIIDDYHNLLELYKSIVESGLVPISTELLISTLDTNELGNSIREPEVQPYEPGKRTAPKTKGNSNTSSNAGSYSQNSKKIGDLGEQVVLEYEKSKLKGLNRSDLAEKIVHEEAQNRRPGWDITSFNEHGEVMRIEVKSSIGSTINDLILTANEWNAANNYKDSYYLYLVTDLKPNKTPRIEVIKDPQSILNEGKFNIDVASYKLKLYEL